MDTIGLAIRIIGTAIGPGMGPVGDEVILSNFPHALMCVEDAQAKCFGLKERELVHCRENLHASLQH